MVYKTLILELWFIDHWWFAEHYLEVCGINFGHNSETSVSLQEVMHLLAIAQFRVLSSLVKALLSN